MALKLNYEAQNLNENYYNRKFANNKKYMNEK